MSTRLITFKEAIREAQEQALSDRSVFLIGEGVGDPKEIFGTTIGLKDKFAHQVFDMPISEAGVTGVCIGASLNGCKPILVHQRMDFSLYSADQLINNAAKWFSMYGGQLSVPIVVRMIIGRGWGQGNQHSQNLTALYAHVPGLKIVMPSNAYDAKKLFLESVADPNPVIFVEHRWLYETTSDMDKEPVEHVGNDITVVAAGHAMLEARKASCFLPDIGIDLIDLKYIKPILNAAQIIESVNCTGKLLVVMDEWKTGGIAGEIISMVAERGQMWSEPPKFARLTYPDYPSASSPGLTSKYYPEACDIAQTIQNMLGRGADLFRRNTPHDVPDANFRGPF